MLEDDRIIEVSWEGKIIWEWVASDHIDELGFSPDARKAIKTASGVNAARGSFDWLHVNSATYVGPNRWFDQGDRRFTPGNVIISSREASLLAIVGRDGSIVWRLGPDFTESKELRAIRQIIGQHHAHLIPNGLPGAGNLLVRHQLPELECARRRRIRADAEGVEEVRDEPNRQMQRRRRDRLVMTMLAGVQLLLGGSPPGEEIEQRDDDEGRDQNEFRIHRW